MLGEGPPLRQRDVFTSWKDIAQYLGKAVRTVQRWERLYGLPVRRPPGHARKSTIVAESGELSEWMDRYFQRRPGLDSDPTALLETAKALQHRHSVLVRQIVESARDMKVNASRLRNTRQETRALIDRCIALQAHARQIAGDRWPTEANSEER